MIPTELKTLQDLFGQDLACWQITEAHFLQRDSHCMGIYPALVAGTKTVVAVLNKKLLRKVWDCIDKRSAKVTTIMVIAHVESEVGFVLDASLKGEAEPLQIFSESSLIKLLENPVAVEWSGGLLSLTDHVREPVFV